MLTQRDVRVLVARIRNKEMRDAQQKRINRSTGLFFSSSEEKEIIVCVRLCMCTVASEVAILLLYRVGRVREVECFQVIKLPENFYR